LSIVVLYFMNPETLMGKQWFQGWIIDQNKWF
jgi:hypothetical protein